MSTSEKIYQVLVLLLESLGTGATASIGKLIKIPQYAMRSACVPKIITARKDNCLRVCDLVHEEEMAQSSRSA